MNKQIEWIVDKFINFNYGDAIRKKSRDMVFQDDKTVVWTYHGITIAKANLVTEEVMLTLAGWPTKSTMERLNALCNKIGIEGNPFRGYGTTRFNAHPTFCGTPIKEDEQINLSMQAIANGAYNAN